ncbi:MAG: hypothetical protein OXF42_00995 [Candidatus Dadabacteria bacterium]|nr:hypothetical protein [Candidatus Dadabacteria bacterium]
MRFLLLLAAAQMVFADVCAAEVRIVEVSRSPVIKDAKVRVVSPPDGGRVFTLSPEVTLDVSGFDLGVQTPFLRKNRIANSARGQHIHLIVDGEPYKAIYDVSKPVRIGRLAPGPHTIVAFPSRSYHESVKSPEAGHAINFTVFALPGASPDIDLSAPAIIYSRPKGVYKGGDARRVMVDYYLHRVSLEADGYAVRVSVLSGGEAVASTVLKKWSPAFVEGLESGEYEFALELLDPAGRAVASQRRVVSIVR